MNFIQLHLQNTDHSHDPLCSDVEQWHFILKTCIRMIALQDKNNQYNEVSFDMKSTNGIANVTCDVCQWPLGQHWSEKLNDDTNFCDCPEEAPFNKKPSNNTQNDHLSSTSQHKRRKSAQC